MGVGANQNRRSGACLWVGLPDPEAHEHLGFRLWCVQVLTVTLDFLLRLVIPTHTQPERATYLLASGYKLEGPLISFPLSNMQFRTKGTKEGVSPSRPQEQPQSSGTCLTLQK